MPEIDVTQLRTNIAEAIKLGVESNFGANRVELSVPMVEALLGRLDDLEQENARLRGE